VDDRVPEAAPRSTEPRRKSSELDEFAESDELEAILDICSATRKKYIRQGMPVVRVPGTNRNRYHLPSVKAWLLSWQSSAGARKPGRPKTTSPLPPMTSKKILGRQGGPAPRRPSSPSPAIASPTGAARSARSGWEPT